MKIKSEIRIGIIGIITVIAVIWGINFLKGKNIFTSKNVYLATYSNIAGLERSASVYMDGYAVGLVERVTYDPQTSPAFSVTMELEEKYSIPKGSRAEIFSEDLLGTKAVRIRRAETSSFHSTGDTLRSAVIPDMISALLNDFEPLLGSINRLAATLDSTGQSMRKLMDNPETKQIVSNLEDASQSMKDQLAAGSDLSQTMKSLSAISENLVKRENEINGIIHDLESITGTLESAPLDTIMNEIRSVSAGLSEITVDIRSGKGSAGLLISSDSLYNQVNTLVNNLDILVNDLNENPGKYLHFSVFGGSKKE